MAKNTVHRRSFLATLALIPLAWFGAGQTNANAFVEVDKDAGNQTVSVKADPRAIECICGKPPPKD